MLERLGSRLVAAQSGRPGVLPGAQICLKHPACPSSVVPAAAALGGAACAIAERPQALALAQSLLQTAQQLVAWQCLGCAGSAGSRGTSLNSCCLALGMELRSLMAREVGTGAGEGVRELVVVRGCPASVSW